MMMGDVSASQPAVLAFCGECQLSQKKILHMALKVPMTINELYRAFPQISEQNIAPLVAQLVQEKKAWAVGRKRVRVSCGVERTQNIYSSREEDRPDDFSEAISILEMSFGLVRIPPPAIVGRVHVLMDE